MSICLHEVDLIVARRPAGFDRDGCERRPVAAGCRHGSQRFRISDIELRRTEEETPVAVPIGTDPINLQGSPNGNFGSVRGEHHMEPSACLYAVSVGVTHDTRAVSVLLEKIVKRARDKVLYDLPHGQGRTNPWVEGSTDERDCRCEDRDEDKPSDADDKEGAPKAAANRFCRLGNIRHIPHRSLREIKVLTIRKSGSLDG